MRSIKKVNWTTYWFLTEWLKLEYPDCKNTRMLAHEMGITYTALHSKAHALSLKKNIKILPFLGKTKCTPAIDEYLHANAFQTPLKRMTKEINTIFRKKNTPLSDTCIGNRLRQLGINVPKEVRDEFRKANLGKSPPNKGKRQVEFMSKATIAKSIPTRFKPGQKVWNQGELGEIRLYLDHPNRNNKNGILEWRIKTDTRRWVPLQKYEWQLKNGPIPPKSMLRCISGDRLDYRPSNWKVITMAENARLNCNYELTDRKVIGLILRGIPKTPENIAAIAASPGLIEMKRKQILLNKQILKTKAHGKVPLRKKAAGHAG